MSKGRRRELRKVMRMAWAIRKENENNVMSECMKMAWDLVKKGITKKYELAELSGSEKQVAWAQQIREIGLKIAYDNALNNTIEKLSSMNNAAAIIERLKFLTSSYKTDEQKATMLKKEDLFM